MNQILGTYLHKTMKGQLGLIININFHRLKGTNVTVNHIRELPQANGIQYEMNYGWTSLGLRFQFICLASLQNCFLVTASKCSSPSKTKTLLCDRLHPKQGNVQPFFIIPTLSPHQQPNQKKLKKISQSKTQLTQIHCYKNLNTANLGLHHQPSHLICITHK